REACLHVGQDRETRGGMGEAGEPRPELRERYPFGYPRRDEVVIDEVRQAEHRQRDAEAYAAERWPLVYDSIPRAPRSGDRQGRAEYPDAAEDGERLEHADPRGCRYEHERQVQQHHP